MSNFLSKKERGGIMHKPSSLHKRPSKKYKYDQLTNLRNPKLYEVMTSLFMKLLLLILTQHLDQFLENGLTRLT